MSWDAVELGEICEINMGKTPSRDNPAYWGGQNTWVAISDMKSDIFISRTKEGITELALKESGIKPVPKGTLLYSFKLSIGKVAITDKQLYTNEAIVALPIINNSLVDLKYLYYAIQMVDLTGIGDKAVKGVTLNKEKLKRLPIPLPPLPIQKQITDILGKADSLRRKDQLLLQKYDELAQSIFYEMFGDAVKNEKSWEVKKLSDICLKITDGTHQSPKFLDNGVPFLFISNIINNKISYRTDSYISEEDYVFLAKRTPIEIGNILLTTVGATYGNPAIIECLDKFAFQRHIAFIKPDHGIVDYRFLFGQMKSQTFKKQIDRKVKGAAQKTLNLLDLKELKVILPPKNRQVEFAQIIQNIEAQREKVTQKQTYSENLFQTLIQQIFAS